jgi:mxaJ protein
MRAAAVCLLALLASSFAAARAGTPAARPPLRVCADPNNLPFSNRDGEGFENKIAERLARALGAELTYTWWPQRRGFLRNTLAAGACDVVIGVPAALDAVAHTAPYYRSTYVFVQRSGRAPVRSFDDPALRRLRIGIPLIGDDGVNPPPEAALARRGIVDNVIGYAVYGDYARPDPPLELLQALLRGEIDVAAAWGPQAGYFARRHHRAGLTLTPITSPPEEGAPFAFDITVGVRAGESGDDLRRRLDRALREQRGAIRKILDDYGIPRV